MTKKFSYVKDFCIFCTATKRLVNCIGRVDVTPAQVKEIGDSCYKLSAWMYKEVVVVTLSN